MRKVVLICVWLMIMSNAILFAQQNVIQIPEARFSKDYLEKMAEINKIKKTNPGKAIKIAEDALSRIKNHYERFTLYYHGIVVTNWLKKDYDSCLRTMIKAQKEGFYFPVSAENGMGLELKGVDGFDEFIRTNDKMKQEAQSNARAEYIVKLPKGYTNDKSYPLLITFTGGFGSHYYLSEQWRSKKLDQEYIVAYLQGEICQGSYLKSYNRENMDNILSIYRNIIKDYSVDTTNVILGGQSLGAYYSIKLAMDKMIPAKGIILFFPHFLGDLDIKFPVLADLGIKFSIMIGEYDYSRVIRSKEIAVDFDKNGIRNRFIIYSEKGHEYPDDHQRQIDLSIDFICGQSSDK